MTLEDKLNNLSLNRAICNLCRRKFEKTTSNFCINCSKLVTYHYPNCDCMYCR